MGTPGAPPLNEAGMAVRRGAEGALGDLAGPPAASVGPRAGPPAASAGPRVDPPAASAGPRADPRVASAAGPRVVSAAVAAPVAANFR